MFSSLLTKKNAKEKVFFYTKKEVTYFFIGEK